MRKNKYLAWNIGPLCDEIARLEEMGSIKEAVRATSALLHLLSERMEGNRDPLLPISFS